MSSATIPLIDKHELDTLSDKPIEYISFLIGKYHMLMATDTSGQIQLQFTTEQNILLAFQIFVDQVSSGGFIQLIENGYGAYIFDNPLSKYLRQWGAVKIATILDQARIIYHNKKAILEKEKSLEEFAKLYQEHKDFELLEAEFSQSISLDTGIIAMYISRHIDRFVLVK
jgi:hypothetical protein